MPSKRILAILRAVLRNRVYRDGNTGGCHLVSRWLEIHYGLPQVTGCFASDAGHGDHCWNLLPDGRILDATADQFARYNWRNKRQTGGKNGIYVGSAKNPRYVANCPCTRGDQKWLQRGSRRMSTLYLTLDELGVR